MFFYMRQQQMQLYTKSTTLHNNIFIHAVLPYNFTMIRTLISVLIIVTISVFVNVRSDLSVTSSR